MYTITDLVSDVLQMMLVVCGYEVNQPTLAGECRPDRVNPRVKPRAQQQLPCAVVDFVYLATSALSFYHTTIA